MSERSEELDKVCRILDKLTLDSLTLMEEEIVIHLEAEKAMSRGESNLARTRYILGHNAVSALQLPTENSNEFEALVKVVREEDKDCSDAKSFALEALEKTGENSDEIQQPMRWFGVLTPHTLTAAKDAYKQALQWFLKSLNIQKQLSETCDKIEQLRAYKASLKFEE